MLSGYILNYTVFFLFIFIMVKKKDIGFMIWYSILPSVLPLMQKATKYCDINVKYELETYENYTLF